MKLEEASRLLHELAVEFEKELKRAEAERGARLQED